MSLSEHGIKVLDPETKKPKKILKFEEEAEFYHQLALEWIPPEERLGKDEIKRYKQDKE
jgi:DNA polymerase/3'-5' exonuclease PolX